MSRSEGKTVDLGSVPDRYGAEIADLGFDGVWLMGLWQRSPAGVAIALSNEDLRVSFDAALPDWQPYDVVGSPDCVPGYVVDDHFGGRSALASARQRSQRGYWPDLLPPSRHLTVGAVPIHHATPPAGGALIRDGDARAPALTVMHVRLPGAAVEECGRASSSTLAARHNH